MQRIYLIIGPRNGIDRTVVSKKTRTKKRCITCCVFSQIKQTAVLYYEAKRGVVFLSFLVPNVHNSKFSYTNLYLFLEIIIHSCDTLQRSKAISQRVGVSVRQGCLYRGTFSGSQSGRYTIIVYPLLWLPEKVPLSIAGCLSQSPYQCKPVYCLDLYVGVKN